MAWIPTIITVGTLVAGGGIAYNQIGQNTEAIKFKVDRSAYETDKDFARDARLRLAADIRDNSESIDENEEAIEDIERGDLEAAGDLKLQIERLQQAQSALGDKSERDVQNINDRLDLILRLLQQNNTPNPFGN